MSIGPGIMIERTLELCRNRELSIGYISVHPEHGVFLGITGENLHPVFKQITELDEEQMIPVVSTPELNEYQCPDTIILECHSYKVDITDPEQKYTRAGDIIEDGDVKLTDKNDVRLKLGPNSNIFTRAAQRALVPVINHVTNAARYLGHHFSNASTPFNSAPSFGAVYQELASNARSLTTPQASQKLV